MQSWRKDYLGSGSVGRNTTIIRSNYVLPHNEPFHQMPMGLWEGLEADLSYNVMVSLRGIINLFHNDLSLLFDRSKMIPVSAVPVWRMRCRTLISTSSEL